MLISVGEDHEARWEGWERPKGQEGARWGGRVGKGVVRMLSGLQSERRLATIWLSHRAG